ncbi:MAG TPA: cytochrome P450 [Candidatus Tumulicola sp.]|nr:cytochrome P450 [Candidatus Tumulicola sp.]
MSKKLPGPGTATTLRRLMPMPFLKFVPFLREMTARYGNLYAFSVPWRRYVFINEPVLIKDVLVTQQQAFSKSLGTRMLRHLLGEGLLTSEDPLHRQMRRIVQPAFHRERIGRYAAAMEAAADDFANGLRADRPFDLHAAMTALTLRIASVTLFGSDASDAAQRVSAALGLMMREFPYVLLPFGELRRRLPLPATRRFQAAKKSLDDIIYALIALRRETPGDDALSMLLAAHDAESGYRPSDEQIRDEVMTLFMAGHETTANLLVWTWYLLAQHPDVDAATAAAAIDGDGDFIDRVVLESLRLYPPAWVVGRESRRAVTLSDGTLVAPKTTVLIAPLLLHRRPEFFRDPDRFDPDRWLGAEPAPFSYLPFGAGARRCIGNDFALREAAIVLRAVTARFSFALEPGVDVRPAPLVTLRPDGPVPVRPSYRRSFSIATTSS